MKERTRKIFIMIVMAALIVSLTAASFAALTYGRYTGGKLDEDSPYEEIIDFVGATAFEVTTPDAFINAINNGYSYIKIADDAEEPFVINNNVADVYTNLVLDVNGHVVVRNSRNPLLDVRRSISVVLVYDSSTEADGGFYNPVGSSLQTSGGTLTVGAGVYESGPNEEHQTESYNIGTEVTLFTRTNRTDTSYSQADNPVSNLPILTGKNTGTQGELVYDHYFEEDPVDTVNELVKADTYLLYTVEKDGYVDGGQLYVNRKEISSSGTTTITAEEFSPICNVASCDFYYYYPVNGTPGKADSPQTYAVVYGYNDVKKLASNEKGAAETLQGSGLVWPYAAIRSVKDEETQEGGVTHARGGEFKTHFGKESTYCIYSAGGTMTVGTAGSDGGPTFDAVGSGVCIAMTDGSENASAGEGGSLTISGGSLTISGGTFSSRLGNTIEMEGGNMTVTAGTFTKSDGKGIERDQLEDQTAMIDMRGGTLNITGDNADSVTMTAGGEDNGGTLENVFGILAHGGGEVSVGGCTFNIYGNYSAGVLSYDGTINLNDDTVINVRETHPEDKITSAGVSSEQASEGEEQASEGAEEHPVNLTGNVKITSDGLGITARGNVNIKKAPDNQSATQVNVETGYATGVYVNGGTFKMESGAEISVESTVQNDYTWGLPPEGQGTAPNIYNGVYVQGGSLVSEGTLNVTFTGVESDKTTGAQAYLNHLIKSYAVRVEAAVSGGKTEVSIAGGKISNSVGGGVYVGGGTVTLGVENGNTGPTVLTTGTDNYDFNNTDFGENSNWNYMVTKTGGDAVKVTNGNLTVYGGSYTAAQGSGILVQQNDTNYQAFVYGGTFSGNDVYSTNQASDSFYTGPGVSYAFKVLGGDLTIYDGRFISEDGGAFVMNGTATMYGGIIAAQGATAFVTYNGAEVIFDPNAELNVQGVPLTDRTLYVSGASTGLTVESVSVADQNISINGGVFTGGTYQIPIDGISQVNGSGADRNGIWYSNGNAKLTISGGTFQGETTSGLYFDVVPSGSNVTLSGGRFISNGWNTDWSGNPSTSKGAINAKDPGDISIGSIVASNFNCYGGENGNEALYSWNSSTQIGGSSATDTRLNDNVYDQNDYFARGQFNQEQYITIK